jgi:hypothetical protein
MSVTQPDPKVVAIDVSAGFSADLVPSTQYIDSVACLELTFDAAGVLTVETDATSMTGGIIEPSVFSPKSGATFGPGGREDVLRGTRRIDIAQPETRQLVVRFVDDSGVPPATGTFRFKFTFTPR